MRMERQEFLGLTGGSVGSLVEALCKTLEQYFYEATSGFYDPSNSTLRKIPTEMYPQG